MFHTSFIAVVALLWMRIYTFFLTWQYFSSFFFIFFSSCDFYLIISRCCTSFYNLPWILHIVFSPFSLTITPADNKGLAIAGLKVFNSLLGISKEICILAEIFGSEIPAIAKPQTVIKHYEIYCIISWVIASIDFVPSIWISLPSDAYSSSPGLVSW